MWRACLACAVCMTGLIAVADEVSPKVRRVIELGEIRRKERLEELHAGLNVLKVQYEDLKSQANIAKNSAYLTPDGRPFSPEEYRKAVEKESHGIKERAAAAFRDIEDVKSQKYYYPNITLKTMRVGDIGIVVDQFGCQESARITQIIDESSAVISVESQLLWLTVDTSDLKVGKRFTMTMPFEVTGTTTYKPPKGGAKKIFVIEQFFFPEDEPAPPQAASRRTEQPR